MTSLMTSLNKRNLLEHSRTPHSNLILQLLTISALALDLRKCLIFAKIDSKPTVAGSILTDGIFLVKNVLKEEFELLAKNVVDPLIPGQKTLWQSLSMSKIHVV